MSSTLRLDLPLLLPDMADARDACVARLESMLSATRGIVRTHVVNGDVPEAAEICVHFDPSVISALDVEGIVTAAGAEVSRSRRRKDGT